MGNNLSKSKYTAYWQCPKLLWLDTYKNTEREPDDPSTKVRMEAGTRVGQLAHGLCPNVVDVTTITPSGKLDMAAMIDRTKQLVDSAPTCAASRDLSNSPLVIAEAAFSFDGCYCAVDLLVRTPNGWDI